MGREILFKGKRKDTGEWIYGQYFENRRFKSHYIWVWEGENHKSYEVIEETVVQFIGHEDINRVKVFHNDIVKDSVYGSMHTVIWLDAECCFVFKQIGVVKTNFSNVVYMMNSSRECIAFNVIGNTYDNPELLEVV